MEQKLASLFLQLGIATVCVGVTDSIAYTSYHFKVCRIEDFKNTEKQVPVISAFLQIPIIYSKSTIGHFALVIPKDKVSKINLLSKSNLKHFKKDYSIFAGIDLENKPVVFNLKDNPHILIAGTTGSGKSVMINSIICQLLLNTNYNTSFYMIDTKRVELSKYKKLRYPSCQVATDFVTAINYLSEVCDLIDIRYLEMEKKHQTCLDNNEAFRIIVVIEELNDLMMASKKAVEQYIVKIAQLGRACGVHLIVATQRPVVETLTGAIKANIDCRIALKTTSSIDSRNILGHGGAEKLRGKGDALLKLPTNSDEIHIQCPFISLEEIDEVVEKYLKGDIFV